MARFNVFGLGVRNGSIQNGGMNIQPLRIPTEVATTPVPRSETTTTIPASPTGATTTRINVGAVGPERVRSDLVNPLAGSLTTLSANRLLNPVIANVPQLKLLKSYFLNQNKKYPIDTLSVAQTRISNGQFVPVMDNGITVFRPEIISIIDFAPIWRVGSQPRNSDIGDFINIQFQASHLRQETLLKLVDKIQRTNRQTTSDDQFNLVRSQFQAELKQTEVNISYFSEMLQNIENIKQSLEIKKIPASFYNSSVYLPLQQFFEKRMQYNRTQYDAFSETKLLLQLLSDFRAIMESYSISLLELEDPDRKSDYSPVKIDKTYTLTNGFTFDISNIRSLSVPINATDTNFFNQFVNSLPQNQDDRIKILTTLLSKEYLISRGLGKQDVQRLLQGFGTGNTGNPFDNIVGEVGNTIFEPPTGPNSIASLMFVNPGIPNASVLPFENKYVDSDDQKFVYVPGSSYFVDSVLTIQGNSWNTGPFVNYVNLFNNQVKSARTVIENLFDMTSIVSTLSPTSVNDKLLFAVKNSTTGLLEKANIDTDQAVISAIFKLANSDSQLKNMLFQYVILVGMAANSTTEQKEIFDIAAATELSSLRNFSHLMVPEGVSPDPKRGLSVLRLYLDQLSETIEDRVTTLITRTNPQLVKSFSPRDIRDQSRPILTSTTINSGLGSSFASKLIGNIGLQSQLNLVSGTTSIQLPRSSISRVLTSVLVSRSQNSSNLIKEFVDLATTLYKSAQIQGTNVHLLTDGTNRTRYNFLSTSTQLLMLFELFCSYANRYVFSTFERTNGTTVATVTVDTVGNKVVRKTIEQIVRKPFLTTVIPDAITTAIKGNTDELARTLGSQNSNIKAQASQGSTVPTNRSAVGISPSSLTKFIPGRLLTSDSSLNKTGIAFSNSIYSQTSKEIADALQNSTVFNDTLATNIENAADIRDLFQSVTDNIDLLGKLVNFSDKYATYRLSLKGNRRKISDELTIIANCLHILVMIGTYMQNASSKVQNVFNQTSLQTFLSRGSLSNLDLLRNPSQLRTAAYVLNDIKSKTPAQTYNEDTSFVYNNLVISDVVTTAEYNCLKALLSEPPYSNTQLDSPAINGRIKILSVGVPSGFSKELVDRVNIGEINSFSFRDKEFDVININVFKRDARFDDIIFKPQKFLFDLSLFATESDINRIQPSPNETFERLLLRAQVTDFQQLTNARKVSLETIGNDPKYNFLLPDERENLIRSHISSHLLGNYINFLTGLRITEDVFRQQETTAQRSLTQQMQQIVFAYLREVKRVNISSTQTIEQLLLSPSLDDETKDILRLFTYGSLVFNQGEVTARVLDPKLFDRIFHIPINIEAFEVDLEQTLSTNSGRNAWRQTYIQNKVREVDGRYFMRARSKNDLIFEDYFVAIETANDKE